MSGSKAQISSLECVCQKKKRPDCAPRGLLFCQATGTHVTAGDVCQNGTDGITLGLSTWGGVTWMEQTCEESMA